jgi:hypothetical protein
MKVKELKRNSTEAEATSELPQIPKNFICVDPSQRDLVFDFLADFNQDLKESALTHLRLCLHCRELAHGLLEIKSGHCLHAEKELVSQAGGSESSDQSGEEDKEIDFA